MQKTNAMRILEGLHIDYEMRTYETADGHIDGVSVAHKAGLAEEAVFKTLVTHFDKSYFVFIIPVGKELDLKKAARAAGVKRIEMLAVKDLQKVTGYIRGGCSPVGQKKLYPTFREKSALEEAKIYVSGGKIGIQMGVAPVDLLRAVSASAADLCLE